MARNQDYPPPFTVVMFHGVFVKGGRTIFEGTTYAGTIGVSTGMSRLDPGWSVSINARSNPAQGTPGGIKFAVEAARQGAFIFPVLMRWALQTLDGSYEKAVAHLASAPLIMPGYIVIAGANTGEGAIITRNASKADARDSDVYSLNAAQGPGPAGGKWYVVQTNTDRWDPAPIYPDTNVSRRATATVALDGIGPDHVDLAGLWTVMSTPPTYNAATIHTELIADAWHEYQTYKRNGPF